MKKLTALLSTLTLTLVLGGCWFDPNGTENPEPKAGVFAENLNKKGEEQPRLYDKVADKVKEVSDNITEEDVDHAIEDAKEVAGNVKDKAEEISGSEQAEKIKGEVKDKFQSGVDKVKEFFGSKPAPAATPDKSIKDIHDYDGKTEVIDFGISDLDFSNYKYNHVEYSDLDNLNRVGVATAYLAPLNVGKSAGREGQTWKPTGFNNQKRMIAGKRQRPYDRGHLIAYTLTFNLDDNGEFARGNEGSLDNPKNLATMTTYANRTLFQKYERQVRDSLKDGHTVIYKVTPDFVGDELVARGFQLEALSDDGSLNFNVYIYNVFDNEEVK